MVLNIKELNLDKHKKYAVFFDGNVDKLEAIQDIHIVESDFKKIGVDNNNIFYFPYPIIIQEK